MTIIGQPACLDHGDSKIILPVQLLAAWRFADGLCEGQLCRQTDGSVEAKLSIV